MSNYSDDSNFENFAEEEESFAQQLATGEMDDESVKLPDFL